MKKHRKNLADYSGNFEQLSNELGDLTYDSLALFLNELSLKISKDGDADNNRGRTKLAGCLKEAATSINNASESINRAWVICEPYTSISEEE